MSCSSKSVYGKIFWLPSAGSGKSASSTIARHVAWPVTDRALRLREERLAALNLAVAGIASGGRSQGELKEDHIGEGRVVDLGLAPATSMRRRETVGLARRARLIGKTAGGDAHIALKRRAGLMCDRPDIGLPIETADHIPFRESVPYPVRNAFDKVIPPRLRLRILA